MRALLLRDLRLSLRAGSGALLGLAFYVVLAGLFPLALPRADGLTAEAAPAVLWIGALLAMILSFDRIYALDVEDGSLDHLLTSGMPALVVVYAKLVVLWLSAGLPLVIAAPLIGVIYGFHLNLTGIFTLAIGTLGMAGLGVFGAALVHQVRRGGLVLPILVLPFSAPSVIFGALVLTRLRDGGETAPPLAILCGITLISLALLPLAAARALRR